jgi:hypothetical protein
MKAAADVRSIPPRSLSCLAAFPGLQQFLELIGNERIGAAVEEGFGCSWQWSWIAV